MRLKPLLALSAVAVAAVAQADEKFVSVKGKITFEKAPKAEVLTVTTDKDKCCKDGDLISNMIQVDAKSKGLANVVVYLRPDSDDRDAKFPADKIDPALAKPVAKNHVIDQPKCQFEPRVVVAREGDTVTVKNSADIAHNINFSSEALNFNVTVPGGKQHEVKDELKADRRPALFKCDIHPWMQGRLFVFDHPYYALTNKDGEFELKNVPVGKWRIVYRHEGGFHQGAKGNLGFPLEVKGDKKTMELEKLEFELPAATK